MPRKKPEEKDQELDIKKPVKKKPYVVRWFDEYAVNNKADLKIICDLTARIAWDQFMMEVKNNEIYAAEFYATFLSILKFIRDNQKTYSDFTIKVCNSINIGYVNNTDEDNEKVGNFMPVMEHIGINRRLIEESPLSEDKTRKDFIRWKELNIKKEVEYYKKIQEDAYRRLIDDYRVDIRHSEGIFPLFCIFLDNIVSVLKLKFQEAQGTDVSEVSLNILGLFDVFYSFDEENNQEIIEFQPNIRMKLALKNDEIAARD